jgi:hypothetical protein
VSGISRLGGLGKRLLQVAAQRVIAAGEEVERRAVVRELPAGSGPAGQDPAPNPHAPSPNRLDPSADPFDAALTRLRAERPPPDPPETHSEAPPDDAR